MKALTERQKKILEEEQKMKNDRLYGMRIDENDEDEKIQCDVCLDFDHEKDNEIVICSLCNVAVH